MGWGGQGLILNSNTSHFFFRVAYIVCFLSHIITLERGEVLSTGTPAGGAAGGGKCEACLQRCRQPHAGGRGAERHRGLARGTVEHLEEIDALIQRYTLNWDLDRITLIDRACLRLALYEMLHCDDIPPVVSINEAVDIAKRFSTAESGKFVNGILDKVKIEELTP